MRNNKILFAIVIVLLITAAGLGLWWVMKKKNDPGAGGYGNGGSNDPYTGPCNQAPNDWHAFDWAGYQEYSPGTPGRAIHPGVWDNWAIGDWAQVTIPGDPSSPYNGIFEVVGTSDDTGGSWVDQVVGINLPVTDGAMGIIRKVYCDSEPPGDLPNS